MTQLMAILFFFFVCESDSPVLFKLTVPHAGSSRNVRLDIKLRLASLHFSNENNKTTAWPGCTSLQTVEQRSRLLHAHKSLDCTAIFVPILRRISVNKYLNRTLMTSHVSLDSRLLSSQPSMLSTGSVKPHPRVSCHWLKAQQRNPRLA